MGRLGSRHVGTGGKRHKLVIARPPNMAMHDCESRCIERLLQRRYYDVVVAALTKKTARTAWCVTVMGKALEGKRWNPLEAVSA